MALKSDNSMTADKSTGPSRRRCLGVPRCEHCFSVSFSPRCRDTSGTSTAFGTWMRTALDYGVSHIYEKVWCDYPPGYLYLLQGVGFLWKTVTNSPIPADNTACDAVSGENYSPIGRYRRSMGSLSHRADPRKQQNSTGSSHRICL